MKKNTHIFASIVLFPAIYSKEIIGEVMTYAHVHCVILEKNKKQSKWISSEN